MTAPPLVRPRRGHSSPITALSVGPGGEVVWTGDDEGRIVGWDSRVGASRYPLRCQSSVLALAASPDGAVLAVGRLEGAALLYHAPPLSAAERNPPSLARYDRRYEAVKALHWEGKFEPAAAVAWSPDGELVAAGSGDYLADRCPITLWRGDGWRSRVLEGHRSRVRALAFSPDGELLASGSDDKSVMLWRIATGEQVAAFAMADDVVAVGWSLDGRRLFAGAYDTMAVLDRRAQPVGGWKGHLVRALAVCPDGKHLATAGLRYGGPGVIRISTLDGVTVHEELGGDDVTAIAYLPDGQLAAAAGPVARLFWGPSCRLRLEDPVRRVISLATNTDRLLLGAADGGARVGNRRTPWVQGLDATAGQWLSRVAPSPDGKRVALASAGGEGKLYDGSSGALVASLPQKGEQWALAWSRDGNRFVAGGHDGMLTIRDGVSGAVLREISLEGVSHQCAAWSADGSRLNVGATDGVLRVWNAHTGEGLANQRCSHGSLLAVAVSPDGRLLATGGEDARLRLFEEQSGNRIGEVTGPRLAVNDVRFSSDGKRLLAASGDGAVYLCNVERLAVERKLEGHEGIVSSAVFWLDERVIVSAGMDGQVIVWNAGTGEPLGALHLVAERGWLVTTTDGRYDVSVEAIGAVLVQAGARRVDGLWAALLAP